MDGLSTAKLYTRFWVHFEVQFLQTDVRYDQISDDFSRSAIREFKVKSFVTFNTNFAVENLQLSVGKVQVPELPHFLTRHVVVYKSSQPPRNCSRHMRLHLRPPIFPRDAPRRTFLPARYCRYPRTKTNQRTRLTRDTTTTCMVDNFCIAIAR